MIPTGLRKAFNVNTFNIRPSHPGSDVNGSNLGGGVCTSAVQSGRSHRSHSGLFLYAVMSRKKKKGKNSRDPMSHAKNVGTKTRRRATVMGICNKRRERLKK